MIFNAGLIVKFGLVVGCGISIPLLVGSQLTSPNNWRKKIEYKGHKGPILDCKGGRVHYQVFIDFKDKSLDTSREILLKVIDVKNNQELDLKDKDWQLTVFKTGTIRIEQLDGRQLGNYDGQDIFCNSNLFEITKTNWGETWEKDITQVKLKLGQCELKSDKEICDIEIEEEVGLKWKIRPTPKAVFKVSLKN